MFEKLKQSESEIPKRIPIIQKENYHTHYLGKTNNGKLFFGTETFVHKKLYWEVKPELQSQNRIDFAILYLFDNNGKFIEFKYWSTEIDNERHKTSEKLEKMVTNLGEVKLCNIEIETFEVNINGIKCGLIPNKEFKSIDLFPSNTISFQEPWNGEYYT